MTFPFISIKKPLFILGASLTLLSCSKGAKPEITTTYDTQFEILNGRVRELTETYNTQSNEAETDITTFDKNGDATQAMRLRGAGNSAIKYSYKYNKNGKKAQITLNDEGTQVTYQCDKNGRVAEMHSEPKEVYVTDIHLYKYDSTGNMIEMESYRGKNLIFLTKYLYSGQHLLMEEDKLNTMKKLVIRVVCSYKGFDKEHNWLKRVNNVEYHFGEIGGDNKPVVRKDTNTRKITYY